MKWHEGLWACVYKAVEVKWVNGNAKSFLCMREEKFWNIEPNETNNSLKKLNKKVIKSSLETLNERK